MTHHVVLKDMFNSTEHLIRETSISKETTTREGEKKINKETDCRAKHKKIHKPIMTLVNPTKSERKKMF